MILKQYTLEEQLASFPDVAKLQLKEDLGNKSFDFYFTALGFEERTLTIPELLEEISTTSNFRCDECIYFTYNTSTNDNAFNEPRLKKALSAVKNKKGAKTNVESLFCDEDNFAKLLIEKLAAKVKTNNTQKVSLLLDISVCSSKLILSLFKILFEIKSIDLITVYTEAAIYYPLYSEFSENPAKFLESSSLSTTKGKELIVNSNEYSEGTKESSDLIVAFACFKADRINRIISDIDESILLNHNDRLIWIVGEPNFESPVDKENRMNMLRAFNGITDEEQVTQYHVSTLNYKETLIRLESIYQDNKSYHFNIADLGSKMQTLAISIFYHYRPDVSVYYAIPSEYNSNRYSSGSKQCWIINFGDFKGFLNSLFMIDQVKLKYTPNPSYPLLNDPGVTPEV